MASNYRLSALSVGFAALILFGLSALPSLAQNWVEYGTSGDGAERITFYYDANSVRTDKNLRYVWCLNKNAEPHYKDYARGYVSSVLAYKAVDCSSATAANIQLIDRDVNERTLVSNSYSDQLEFTAGPPGSIAEELINTVCSLGTRKEEPRRTEERRDALPSPSANWVWVHTSGAGKDAISMRYEADSVRIDADFRYAWVRVDLSTPKKHRGQPFRAVLFHEVFNCSSRTMTENRAVYLASVNGGILGDVPLDPKFETPELGLGQEKLLNTVCSLNVRRGGTPHTEGNGEGTDETSTVGSGFVVSAAGMVLTNAHVVSGCEAIRVTTARGERRTASLAAADPQSDLALLSSSGGFSSVAAFRAGRPLRLAEEIVALGYPLHGLLASGVNVSTGTVSALAGIANDSAKVQISAPVQPGNSGGPVLDLSGALVGIVVAKLDAIKMAKAIGDIPQNVNFAIKADVARLFLEAQGVSLQSAPAGPPRKKEDVAAMGREFTVLVECLKGEDAK